MQLLKVALVMAAGLGSTWAARETTDLLLGPPGPASLAQAASEEPAADAGARPAQPATVPELSQAEVDAEIKRAEAEIAGKSPSGEPEEFRPSRPLPADLRIALPSDI